MMAALACGRSKTGGFSVCELNILNGTDSIMRVLTIEDSLDNVVLRAASHDFSLEELMSDEFKKLERALDKWVKQKKFSEYDKSREEVARELGTTKEHLHLYFTTKKGIDFKTWRTELRINEAKRLLLENREMSTNVIGEIAGFSDRSNFYRQFVKLVGCSPRQWRESNGKI